MPPVVEKVLQDLGWIEWDEKVHDED